ncbi:MAG: UDP-N-acetylmuramoyl-L-alanyl-D-glutamate--2,6-diaminopimelate ligase, partial [Acidimicrobiales bacterium]
MATDKPPAPEGRPAPHRIGLDDLVAGADVLDRRGGGAVEVTGVTYDTRGGVAGSLFCCLRGRHVDAHD